MQQTNIAIFPGTFDPITLGHVSVIQKAKKIFDNLIIAVARGHHKNPLINLETRLKFCDDFFKLQKGIQVLPLEGLLVNFAISHNASWIIRGIRNSADLNYEMQLANVNKSMLSSLETLFLLSDHKYNMISSSMVRELFLLGADISSFVPQEISKLLQKR